MILRLLFISLTIGGMLIVPVYANAQIYTFTDKKGVLHFTNVPTDNKYRLYRSSNWGSRANSHEKHHLYENIINWAARKHGVHAALIKAIIRVESDFDPGAVSRKGARGLMQLMPETTKILAVTNPFDPRENIEAGVRLFSHLLTQLDGDIVLALAAYNAGLTSVKEYQNIPPFRETTDYVKKVLHFFRQYR